VSEKENPIPKRNSAQWVKNERLINSTPYLRAARDTAEGFTPRQNAGATHVPREAYKRNYDAVFGRKDKSDD
jgi:hypothetical protein